MEDISSEIMSDIGSKVNSKTENFTKLSAPDHSSTGNKVENSLNSSINMDSKSETTDIDKRDDANKTELPVEKTSSSEILKTDAISSDGSQQSLVKAKTNDTSKDGSDATSNQASSTTAVADEIHDSTSKASLSSPIHNSEMDNKLPENPLLSQKGNSTKDEQTTVSCDTKNETESDHKTIDTKQTAVVSVASEAMSSTAKTDETSTDAMNSTGKTSLNQEQATVSNRISQTTDARPDATSKSDQIDTPHSAAKITNRELSEKYAPYILPGDQTLEDARDRLKTAIEQTRELRLAFTKNLYDKYRIVLRPVPKSAEAIVAAIRAQPKVVNEKILQEIQMIATEKEIEKRAAQKLNSDFANASTTSDISSWLGGLQGVDNAEQLCWYGVGLYLVVLPEEDINEADLADCGVTERGPIDPATGNKSKDLVQSAALASSSMLDRVRKAAELRRERIQNQDYTSIGEFVSDPQPSFTTSRPLKKSPVMSTRPSPPSTKSQKNKPSSSLISLLNLSPHAEGVRSNGKLSAPGFALNTCSLKSSSTRSRVHNRHPFPQSKGARSITYGRSSGPFSSHPFSLPSLTTASERKMKISSDDIDVISETTLSTLKSVINPVLSFSANHNSNSDRIKMKRKFNEIRIVEELKNKAESKSKTQPEENMSKGADFTDPCLVLAVMKSLGLLVSSKKSNTKNGNSRHILGLQEIFGEEKLDYLNSVNIVDDTILERVSKRQKRSSFSFEYSKPTEAKNADIQDMQYDNSTADESTVLQSIGKFEQTTSSHSSSTRDSNNQYVPNLRGGGEESKPDIKCTSDSKATPTVSGIDLKQMVHPLNSSKQMIQSQESSQFASSKAYNTMSSYHVGNNIEPISATMNPAQGQRNIDCLGTVHEQHRLSTHTQANVPLNQMKQLQATSIQQNEMLGPSSTVAPSEYVNGMHPMQIQSLMNHHNAEWASLANQQHGVRSGPGSSFDPLSMGLTPHQAAILVRNGAAQAIFAREHPMHAQVVATQHNASAYVMSQAVMMNPVTIPQYGYIPPAAENKINLMAEGKQMNHPGEMGSKTHKVTSSVQPTQTNGSGNNEKPSSSPAQNYSEKRENKLTVRDEQNLQKKTSTHHQRQNGENLTSKESNISLSSSGVNVASSNNEKTEQDGLVSNAAFQTNSKSLKSRTASNNANITSVNDAEHSTTISEPSTTNINKIASSVNGIENPTTDSKSPQATFSMPPHSNDLNEIEAQKIRKGLFHEINTPSIDKDENGGGKDDYIKHRLQYLLKVSATVPISKTFVLGLLKDKLVVPRLKAVMASFTQKNGIASPFEIIVAIVVTWIWSNYRSLFEKAFEHTGRIDVDPRCKWIVKAAIESVTDEAVTKELNKLSILPSPSEGMKETNESIGDILYPIAILMSKALNRGLSINSEVNTVLSNYDILVNYLDRLREEALRLRSQERVLMANLIAKRIRMSEAFSNAYTSSMVRAGNALGYDDLGEIVQDEETSSFSMLPFDILSDSFEAWEDPYRPLDGYSSNLDSDELSKKAHARAMIQRSLKKLQDRHNIKGGTETAGPYSDVPDEQSAYDIPISPSPRPSPRSGVKRKLSSMSLVGESSIRGLDLAVSSVFNPGHFSAPFHWDKNSVACSPYGRHDRNLKFTSSPDIENREVKIPQSSEAIDWQSVASMFEDVVHVEKSSSRVQDDHHNVAVPLGSNIIAPFCRKCDGTMASSDIDSDSDNEEDLDDDHILAAHTGVLDTIKEKFDTMMRIRQEYLDRSRRHSFGRH